MKYLIGISMEKLAEFNEDKINLIFYQIRKAIDIINSEYWNEKKLRISIPEYFKDILYSSHPIFDNAPIEDENKETFLFGIKTIPAFDNYIVVFSLDNPLYKNTNYQVISLK